MARINVLDHGVTGDGVTNDSAAIQNILNNVAGSLDIVDFPALTYVMGQILIPSHRVIEAIGAQFLIPKAVPFAWGFRTFVGSENIMLLGGEYIGDRGNLTGYQWGKNIIVDQATDVTIDSVVSRTGKFDGLSIDGNPSTPSQRVKILNSQFIDNGRNGMSITLAEGVYIYNCEFLDNRGTLLGAGLDVEPNQEGHVDDVMVIGCVARNNHQGFYDHHNAPSTQGIGRVYVRCIAEGNGKIGFINNRNTNVTYLECISRNNGFDISNGSGMSLGNNANEVNLIGTVIQTNRRGLLFAGVQKARVFNTTLVDDTIEQISGAWGPGVSGDSFFYNNK